MDDDTISPQFHSLLNSFCQAVGLPLDDQALGLEFEAGGHTVVVAEDPRADDRLLVEVLVGGVGELREGATMLLHQLNDAARLEHDWVVSISQAQALRLHTQQPIASTSAGDLEGLLAEGIERAAALAQLLASMPAGAGADEPAPVRFDPAAAGMLRA
jgi:hypothetical protein